MSGNFISRGWRGDLPLFCIFWGYGVVPSMLAILLAAWLGLRGHIGDAAIAVLVLVLFVYTVWILVSVWRTAERRGDRDLYGVMARWLTVAWGINAILVGGFVLLSLLT